MTWRPPHEANADRDDCMRRVIMSGYYRESGLLFPNVGEAYFSDPDERGSRWIWKDDGDVINALSFQDLPDFPIEKENDKYACGGATRFPVTEREE